MLKLKKVKSIANPYKLQCSYYKRRKIVNIRDRTIFSLFPKTPISILLTIIEEFIVEEANAKRIIEKLNDRYNLSDLGKKIYMIF